MEIHKSKFDFRNQEKFREITSYLEVVKQVQNLV